MSDTYIFRGFEWITIPGTVLYSLAAWPKVDRHPMSVHDLFAGGLEKGSSRLGGRILSKVCGS